MMTKTTKKDDRGFTLVELIIGVAIFAIVITPLLHALVVGANSTKKNRQYNDATIVAENIAEDIAATDMATYLKDNCYNEKRHIYERVDYTKDDNYLASLTGRTSDANGSGTKYDATVTIVAENADIAIARQMTTKFDLQQEDSAVYNQYLAEGGTDADDISRSLQMDIAADGDDAVRVTITLSYKATINYEDGEGTPRTQLFERTVNRTKAVSLVGASSFPVYIFLSDKPTAQVTDADGVVSTKQLTNMTPQKNIIVNNSTKYDLSLFLVDIAEATNIQHEVYYYPTSKGDGAMKLQSNMPKLTYKAFNPGDRNWMRSKAVTPGLMETMNIQCRYKVTIEVYKAGTAETEDPVCTLTTDKLDYTSQY